MANKGLDAGKSFLAGVLAKLPEGLRGNVTALMEDPTFATAIGEGTLAQSEFSRLTNELTTQRTELDTRAGELDAREQGLESWHGQLNTWYGVNKTLIEEANAARTANGGHPPKVTPPAGSGGGGTPPATGLTADELEARIAQERAGFLGFQRDTNELMRQHFATFGEVLDINPLLTHKDVANLGLIGVYQLVNKDRLDAHRTKIEKDKEDAIRKDERDKVLAQQTTMPYVTPTGVGSGSPLDALTVGKPDALVDQATAHYQRLQMERNGAPAGAVR